MVTQRELGSSKNPGGDRRRDSGSESDSGRQPRLEVTKRDSERFERTKNAKEQFLASLEFQDLPTTIRGAISHQVDEEIVWLNNKPDFAINDNSELAVERAVLKAIKDPGPNPQLDWTTRADSDWTRLQSVDKKTGLSGSELELTERLEHLEDIIERASDLLASPELEALAENTRELIENQMNKEIVFLHQDRFAINDNSVLAAERALLKAMVEPGPNPKLDWKPTENSYWTRLQDLNDLDPETVDRMYEYQLERAIAYYQALDKVDLTSDSVQRSGIQAVEDFIRKSDSSQRKNLDEWKLYKGHLTKLYSFFKARETNPETGEVNGFSPGNEVSARVAHESFEVAKALLEKLRNNLQAPKSDSSDTAHPQDIEMPDVADHGPSELSGDASTVRADTRSMDDRLMDAMKSVKLDIKTVKNKKRYYEHAFTDNRLSLVYKQELKDSFYRAIAAIKYARSETQDQKTFHRGSESVFGSPEIGILASEHESTKVSSTSENSAQSFDSAVGQSHDGADHEKESHDDANQTRSHRKGDSNTQFANLKEAVTYLLSDMCTDLATAIDYFRQTREEWADALREQGLVLDPVSKELRELAESEKDVNFDKVDENIIDMIQTTSAQAKIIKQHNKIPNSIKEAVTNIRRFTNFTVNEGKKDRFCDLLTAKTSALTLYDVKEDAPHYKKSSNLQEVVKDVKKNLSSSVAERWRQEVAVAAAQSTEGQTPGGGSDDAGEGGSKDA